MTPRHARSEISKTQNAEDYEPMLVTALVALKAAHDEENVCSCPFDRCVLSEKWARGRVGGTRRQTMLAQLDETMDG